MKFGYINKNRFSYFTDKEGNYVINGKIKHKVLQKYDVIGLKVIDKFDIYIAKCTIVENFISILDFKYVDIFTNNVICFGEITDKDTFREKIKCNGSIELLTRENINEYLMYFNLLKAEYTPEDIKFLLTKIQDTFKCPETKTKKLIKKDK